MNDETKPEEQTGEFAAPAADGWSMPDPVFRSSEGHTPKSVTHDPEAEIDTDIANLDESEFDETLEIDQAETTESVLDETAVKAPVAKKKGGCAKSFLFILGAVGFGAFLIVAAAVYFLFYYRAAESSF